MGNRYLVELTDGPSMYYGFSYIDTEDDLAHFLFDHLKVDVLPDMEFELGGPYKAVMCRIPRQQRKAFLKAIDTLPDLMAYVGRTDYDDFCLEFFRRADRFLRKQGVGQITPLQ